MLPLLLWFTSLSNSNLIDIHCNTYTHDDDNYSTYVDGLALATLFTGPPWRGSSLTLLDN